MTAQAVTRVEPEVPAISETAAIVQMIERAAMNPAVDIDKMERLLEMQERVMARRAKAAYIDALAAAQSELPIIVERGEGHGNIRYALWEDINEAIKPILAKHGFALSFKTGWDGDKISVTGVLAHREGHSEETTMLLPSDTSGSKNAVQAVGSSTSYGKRYTAQALLNLTSRGEDDDGEAAGIGETVTEEQLTALREKIEATKADIEKFCRFFRIESLPEPAWASLQLPSSPRSSPTAEAVVIARCVGPTC
jgi:hypothetical protein